MELIIYGAKSLALGVYYALRELYPQYPVKGFLVKTLQGNPSTLAGVPVWELDKVHCKEKHILIATPENLHADIIKDLECYGFFHYTCIDSRKEAKLMEAYFAKTGQFQGLHLLPRGKMRSNVWVYMAKFAKDPKLQRNHQLPDWVHPIQVGTALTGERLQKVCDCDGENISIKNVNYCELTALYWIWKNHITDMSDMRDTYYGLFHYRRILDVAEDDLFRFQENNIDIVLPYPTLHEPGIMEHHSRYMKEDDWKAMCQALQELHPQYAQAFAGILAQPYLYNYNMLIARKNILDDYCTWLFPILERTEELSAPRGWERADRYIGYLGENLLTLYFMYHKEDLNIVHTGRYMLL